MNIDKLKIDKLTQQAQTIYGHLTNLYENANKAPMKSELLAHAFMHLGSAAEILELVTNKLYYQNEQLIKLRNLVEAERQCYTNLLALAPDGYLVTDANGIIQEANQAAVSLLKTSKPFLLNKRIINFIRFEERHRFRYEVSQLSQANRHKELTFHLQQCNAESFLARLTVASVYDTQGNTISLRWLVRNLTECQSNQVVSLNGTSCLTPELPTHQYSKGEVIPNHWQAIWYVCRGAVKLSTLCETGDEVLIGLISEGMVFGCKLTKLKTYQAVVLSDVELILIEQAQIKAYSVLSHTLLQKFNQRLQQTESLLVLSGRRRVHNRLEDLLQLLKQDIGQPLENGTRLGVRLTHQDLANACCCTRVTITKLLNKLRKQGKISFDSDKHLIINNID